MQETIFNHSMDDKHHLTNPTMVSAPKQILLVDDDIDAILLLQKIFFDYGAEPTICSDAKQAKKMLTSKTWDLIILDWHLEPFVYASRVVRAADKFISKIDSIHKDRSQHPSPIITYSALPSDKVKLPEMQHFTVWDHWEKSKGYLFLRERTIEVVNQLKIGNK